MNALGLTEHSFAHVTLVAERAAYILETLGYDEGTGVPVNPAAAALILADKSDVRRNRVRNTDQATFDIHDRMNYSVTEAKLKINSSHTIIKLKLSVDTHYGSVMEYFENFMERMILCREVAVVHRTKEKRRATGAQRKFAS